MPKWLEFLKDRAHFYVDFSGGKDSLAVLELVYQNFPRDRFEVLYVRWPDNTHPECDRYVHRVARELDVKLRVQTIPHRFFELLVEWGCPNFKARWCKRLKMRELAKFPGVHVTGVTARRGKVGVVGYSRSSSTVVVAPLLETPHRPTLPLNPLYEKIQTSGNYMFCPFMNREAIRLIMSSSEYSHVIREALSKIKRPGRYVKRWLEEAPQASLLGFVETN